MLDKVDFVCDGPLAQLVEHLTLNQQVPGSIPGRPTIKIKHLAHYGLCAFLFGYMPVIFYRDIMVHFNITTAKYFLIIQENIKPVHLLKKEVIPKTCIHVTSAP